MAKKVQRSNMTQTDSKGKVLREPKIEDIDNPNKFYWWKADQDDMAEQVAGTLKFLQTHNNNTRLEQLSVSTRLYGNTSGYGMLGTSFTRASSVTSSVQSQRISFNLCSSVVDTLTSKIAKNKVIPTFATNNGDWKTQRKADKLNQFSDGMSYQNKIPMKGCQGFKDSAVWGLGLVKIHEENERVKVTRTFPHEVWWDQVEALAGDIRQFHQVKIVDRSIVLECFPDKADEIEKAMPSSYSDLGSQGSVADLVTLTESWHLKSGPDADDGKHILCIGDVVLTPEDEQDYDKDYFPFAFMRYSPKLLGFDGQGACERLQNLQGEINRNMIVIQKSLWMQAGPKIYLPIGSKIATQHINNEVAAIIQGNEPPSYLTPPCVQPEVYSWVDSLIEKGYRQEGVSPMGASGTKPMGLDSGRAIREMTNVEEDRFLALQQEYEGFILEIHRQCIEVAKDIYKRKGSYDVIFPSQNFVQTIDWAEIDLEADEYVLKAYPTSSLPEEPAGRLQTIQEYMQAGIVSPKQGRWLLTKLDLSMSDSLANAPEDLLHKLIEMILDGDKDAETNAEPFYDLNLAKPMALQYYNYAKLHNAPEESLQALRDFMTSIDDLTGVNVPPPPPGAPGLAPANPTMTPTSPLLPNVNQPMAS